MRLSSSLAGSLLLFAAQCFGADSLPTLETESLAGRKVVLPDAAKGHPAVLVIGFTHASQNQMKPWSTSLEPDFPTYSIAVLEDAPRLVRPMAVAGMKSGVAQDQRPRYLVLTHREKELKAAAAFTTADDAYLLLLDRDGAIRWRFHGSFTDAARADLKSQFAALDLSK